MKPASQLIDEFVAESLRVKEQFFEENKERIAHRKEDFVFWQRRKCGRCTTSGGRNGRQIRSGPIAIGCDRSFDGQFNPNGSGKRLRLRERFFAPDRSFR